MRITWEDGSSVVSYFAGKGVSKSTVAIEHEKLPEAESREAMKGFWGERLEALADLLHPAGR